MPAKNFSILAGLLILAGLSGGTLRAAQLGDKAPELKLLGPAPVMAEGQGQVRVFWTTWADREAAFIRSLDQLVREGAFGGMRPVVICDESRDAVETFFGQHGLKPSFTVGFDDSYHCTMGHMAAFKVESYPHVFLVDEKERIAWTGNSLGEASRTARRIERGYYSIERVLEYQQQQERLEKYFQAVAHGDESHEIRKLGMEFIRNETRSPIGLNQFAWSILTDERISHRDHEVALTAAKAAYELARGRHPEIVDTYARAQFVSGNIDEAIRLQKEAIELCRKPELREKFEETLKSYKEAGKATR